MYQGMPAIFQDFQDLATFHAVGVDLLEIPADADITVDQKQSWIAALSALRTEISTIRQDWSEDVLIGLQEGRFDEGDARRRAIQSAFERGLKMIGLINRIGESQEVSRTRTELMKLSMKFEGYLQNRAAILQRLEAYSFDELYTELRMTQPKEGSAL